MIALSLGWGVQSFALAAMSALGELPKVDVAIHADTTHEREATYAFAAQWTPWLEARGVHVATVINDGREGTDVVIGGGKFRFPPTPPVPKAMGAYVANVQVHGRFARCAAICNNIVTGDRLSCG